MRTSERSKRNVKKEKWGDRLINIYKKKEQVTKKGKQNKSDDNFQKWLKKKSHVSNTRNSDTKDEPKILQKIKTVSKMTTT